MENFAIQKLHEHIVTQIASQVLFQVIGLGCGSGSGQIQCYSMPDLDSFLSWIHIRHF